MSLLKPELGQILGFGGNARIGAFEMPDIAKAAVHYLMKRIQTVFWNVNQREWDLRVDPKIPGIHFHDWRMDDESEDAEKPNLWVEGFEDVEIRWYKYFGRSLNCTCERDNNEWSKWMDAALKFVAEEDARGLVRDR